MVFTSVARQNKEIDTRIGKANTAVHELYRSVITKRELSPTSKLSILRSDPHLCSWILGNDWKNTISSTSGRDGILRKVYFVTLNDKVNSCENRKTLNAEPLFQIETSQLRSLGRVTRMLQGGLARWVLLAKPAGKRPKGRPRTRWCDYISDLAWSRLGVEPAELSEVAENRDVFRELLGLLPPRSSREEERV